MFRFFATWPIYLLHFIFEIFNFSVRNIKRSSFVYYIPLFVPILLFCTHIMFDTSIIECVINMIGSIPAGVNDVLGDLSSGANVTVFTVIVAHIIVIFYGALKLLLLRRLSIILLV